MVFMYLLSFILGGFISFILYGKVPMIVSLLISFMIGGLIGYIYFRIKRKKADREYAEWMKSTGLINFKETEL